MWSIDSATLSLEHKMFLQLTPWFWRSIRLAAWRMQCSLRETSDKLFFCFVSFAHAHCIKKVTSGKIWKKSFGYSIKIGKAMFFFFFPWMRESATFERLSIFLECPIDSDDFLEQIQYSRNGRHKCTNPIQQYHIKVHSCALNHAITIFQKW